MKRTFNRKHHMQQGFSLIEVLVSLAIFTVVMVMAVGMLMVLIHANARAQNIQTVMVNISFALDSITREARTGSDFYCGSPDQLPVSGSATSNCQNGGAAFSFNEGGKSLTGNTLPDSRRIGIRVNNGVLERRLGYGDGDGIYEDVDWSPITSDAVHITDLEFYVTGATRGDTMSPTVTIYIAGTAGAMDGSEGTFSIQTTVVQQLLDV